MYFCIHGLGQLNENKIKFELKINSHSLITVCGSPSAPVVHRGLAGQLLTLQARQFRDYADRIDVRSLFASTKHFCVCSKNTL